MQRPNSKFHFQKSFLFFCVASLLGFAAGAGSVFFANNTSSQEFASTEKKSSEGDVTYEKLACPNPARMKELFTSVNFSQDPKTWNCDDELISKLAKTLDLAANVKFNFPQDWAAELQKDFKNIPAFIGQNTKKLSYDLNQTDSLAYNRVDEKSVFLSRRLYDEGPLDALSILVHESRHSVESADSHVTCIAGDMPRYPGACDTSLKTDEKTAGAYSYGTWFELGMGLYAQDLSVGDSEFMLSSGIMTMATRFNTMPSDLGHHLDLIVVTDRRNNIYAVQPFTGDLLPLNIKFPVEGERNVRVEYQTRINGLLIITNKGNAYSWSLKKGLEPFFPKQLAAAKIRPVFINRVYVPFNDGTYNMYLTSDNRLWYSQYNPDVNDYTFKPYEYAWRGYQNRKTMPTPSVKTYFPALYNETLVIDKSGYAYMAPHFGNEEPFILAPFLKHTRRWIAGHGGVYSDSLYLADESGRVYNWTSTYKPSAHDPEQDELTFEKQESAIQSKDGVLQYTQGIHVQALVNLRGELEVLPEKGDRFKIRPPADDFNQVVIIRSTWTESVLNSTAAPTADNFASVCNVRNPQVDPWTRRAFGIDEKGDVIFAGTSVKPCLKMDSQKASARSVQPMNAPLHEKDLYSRGFLKIETTSGPQEVYPYSR